ncbi:MULTISPECIES: NHL repeat-containing protein [Streptomyces]|uniref:hypothetical protein n=1 Tax=Streptomyces TaxID=1883 RepID=UPI00163BC749|nr:MULTISPECIES: hypothetical protein [Streptomyces]MBC2874032.1 hypothetical protein [Streptomyces sp. TYQ1024]UBI39033.1 hypothetical protein K7I03_22960 [Streptomyces mobaraensis]UKW31611.1 hypothetical protein MCU78_22905 [Streptomyces sp. TYQ1024]
MSFGNVFDKGGDQHDSAEQSTEKLRKNTPGADGVSKDAGDLEKERDPWLVRQTAHGAFAAMEFLGGLFRNAKEVSTAQRKVSEDPQSVSRTASSNMKACGPPKVEISDKDMPKMDDLSKLIDNRAAYALVATDLGSSEGLAVDPARNTAYVTDRAGHKLSAVDLTTGAQRVIAKDLGDVGDVKVDGKGHAYVTDYAGARLLVVNLSDGSFTPLTGVTGAYGVALDGKKNKAYVADYAEGQLTEVDLGGKDTRPAATGLGAAGGNIDCVALDGKGKAYVGDTAGNVQEVDLADGRHHVLTNLPGADAVRVELDGAGRAYAVDPRQTGRLYEITLADGAQRVVATGLQLCKGLALDTADGQIYVSNQQGQLWRIATCATEAPGGVGQVRPPPGT